MRRKAQDPGLLLEKEASRKEMSRQKQKAFAEVLGVSTRTVEAWETGRSTPSSNCPQSHVSDFPAA